MNTLRSTPSSRSMESYKLEKSLWTIDDYDQMNWHGVHVHAFALRPEAFELLLDLDYIFKSVDPLPGESESRYWLSPATLVFECVRNLSFQIQSGGELYLARIHRSDPKPMSSDPKWIRRIDYEWLLEFTEGEISFRAAIFRQSIRKNPVLHPFQAFSSKERGGFSFEIRRTKNSKR